MGSTREAYHRGQGLDPVTILLLLFGADLAAGNHARAASLRARRRGATSFPGQAVDQQSVVIREAPSGAGRSSAGSLPGESRRVGGRGSSDERAAGIEAELCAGDYSRRVTAVRHGVSAMTVSRLAARMAERRALTEPGGRLQTVRSARSVLRQPTFAGMVSASRRTPTAATTGRAQIRRPPRGRATAATTRRKMRAWCVSGRAEICTLDIALLPLGHFSPRECTHRLFFLGNQSEGTNDERRCTELS